MRAVYSDEATLQAAAKSENTKVAVVALPDKPFPLGHTYYKDQEGRMHKQLVRMDNGHVLYSGVFVLVDEQVPMGTAGSLKMPRTASILSEPRADIGETLGGYYIRTSRQHGGDPARVGEFLDLVQSTDPKAKAAGKDGTLNKAPTLTQANATTAAGDKIVFVPQRTGSPLVDWPLLVDSFANTSAYANAPDMLPVGAGALTGRGFTPHAPLPGALPASGTEVATAKGAAAQVGVAGEVTAAGLSRSYATPFAFKAAVQVYTGGIRIEVDGTLVKDGELPAIAYASSGAPGTVRSYSTTDERVA